MKQNRTDQYCKRNGQNDSKTSCKSLHDGNAYVVGVDDLLIGMDRSNLRTMQRICGGDPDGKLHLLLDFTDRKGEEVADPWYTGDFDAVWEDLLEGCQALLREYR